MYGMPASVEHTSPNHHIHGTHAAAWLSKASPSGHRWSGVVGVDVGATEGDMYATTLSVLCVVGAGGGGDGGGGAGGMGGHGWCVWGVGGTLGVAVG